MPYRWKIRTGFSVVKRERERSTSPTPLCLNAERHKRATYQERITQRCSNLLLAKGLLKKFVHVLHRSSRAEFQTNLAPCKVSPTKSVKEQGAF